MESFVLDESVNYVCVGPVESALSACVKIESGLEEPKCWRNPPHSYCGGTVLVHDVDVRLPTLHGNWSSGNLFNQCGHICGGMVWHESVGNTKEAARLLFDMEQAGAEVICNQENQAVLALGIRFIGRYSWQEDNELTDPALCVDGDDDDAMTRYLFERGPTCFFVPQKTFREDVLPQYSERLKCFHSILSHREAEAKAAQSSTDTSDFGEQSKESEDTELQSLRFPSMTRFGNTGVGFFFAQQEYLFGRVWFTPEGKCKAFCCYTYASPSFFCQMRLVDQPICPSVPPLVPSDGDEQERNLLLQDNYYTKKLIDTLLAVHLDDVSLGGALSEFSGPFLSHVLNTSARSSPEFLIKVFYAPLLNITDDLVWSVFYHSYRSHPMDPALARALVDCIPQCILDAMGHTDTQRFESVQEALKNWDGKSSTYPFRKIDDASNNAKRCSLLVYHLDRPEVFGELLRRGYPVRSSLGDASMEWFRTAFCEACLDGLVHQVTMMLDAYASRAGGDDCGLVDEAVGDDPWNGMAYAAAGPKADELLGALRARFPSHPVWDRQDIPLDMKMPPKMNLFSKEEDEEDEEDDEYDGEYEASQPSDIAKGIAKGSLEDIKLKYAEERSKRESAQQGGNFGFFSSF
jgi:hypothetical protein